MHQELGKVLLQRIVLLYSQLSIVDLFSPFYHWGKWGPKRVGNIVPNKFANLGSTGAVLLFREPENASPILQMKKLKRARMLSMLLQGRRGPEFRSPLALSSFAFMCSYRMFCVEHVCRDNSYNKDMRRRGVRILWYWRVRHIIKKTCMKGPITYNL